MNPWTNKNMPRDAFKWQTQPIRTHQHSSVMRSNELDYSMSAQPLMHVCWTSSTLGQYEQWPSMHPDHVQGHGQHALAMCTCMRVNFGADSTLAKALLDVLESWQRLWLEWESSWAMTLDVTGVHDTNALRETLVLRLIQSITCLVPNHMWSGALTKQLWTLHWCWWKLPLGRGILSASIQVHGHIGNQASV